jgi:hypothetical protein
MNRALALAAAIALAGCQSVPGASWFGMHDAPVAQPAPQPIIKTVVKQVCLPWREWNKDDLTALHDALVPVPDGSPIIKAVRDWKRYYDDDKACIDAQK